MNGDGPEPPGQIEFIKPGLWDAILAVQSEAPTLPKDKTATVATQKGSYQYSYTDLGTLNDLLSPILRRHGLVWSASPSGTRSDPALSYLLVHVASGQQLVGKMPLFLAKEDSQGHGSAITYARRYAKVAVLDLVADEDDDGQAASRPEAGTTRGGVDLRGTAKGLNDAAINAARESVGLPKLEKPWGSLVNIPAEKAEDFTRALDAARAAS